MVIEQYLMRLLKVQGGLMHGHGISTSQLAYFVLAFPACLKVCEAMERLTGVYMNSTEQHVKLRDSCRSADKRDEDMFMSWMKQHFHWAESNCLRSLFSGVIGHEKINCHNAFSVGSAAMKTMIGCNFTDVKLTRKNRVLPFAAVNTSITISNEVVPVNPQQLFMSIVWTVNNNTGGLLHYLKYDVSMRKTAKSALLDVFNSSPAPEILQETSTFIIDGRYLLRFLVWPRPATFRIVVESYLQYVVRHYSTSAIVVFDGYDDVLSTKEERKQRSLHKTSPNMSFDSSTIITVSQAEVLSNGHNKARFISILSQEFNCAGLKVHQAVADAETLIVRTALQEATEGREFIVVATDTDILIMLLARADEGTSMHLLSPGSKIYSVGDIQRQICAKKICLLFIHAVTGCDTTSAVFGKRKKKAWRLLNKPNVQCIAAVFNNPSAEKGQIITAGEQFLIQLHTSFDELCGRMYARSLARQVVNASFELATLLPKSAASQQYNLRTCMQLSCGAFRVEYCNIINYGTVLSLDVPLYTSGQSLIPVATELPPAPNDLLQLISCACKAECATRCSCSTASLSCSMMCAHCRGRSCHNESNPEHEEDTPDAPDKL
ncbi:hypothetical protein PR048_018159 [Dryococelus australis]|uniref:Tesmin/TSO1-like CXC domain-containing protein n=1 Tax=Dryococelus australis TaxID=614101 RepID=A0ABQ9HBK4_9NEOP|nr:hypothetical protein PR048_018159 [Dryococelus australis]